MVEVMTPAVDLSLTTLDVVKLRLGVEDNSQDVALRALIKGASESMIHYTGFVWPKQGYRERLHGSGSLEIQLSRRPLISITNLTVGENVVSGSDYSIIDLNQSLIFRSVGWPSQRYMVEGVAGWLMPVESGMSARNVVVEYTAGYVTPQMEIDNNLLDRNLPQDVEELCIELVKWSFSQKDKLPINEVKTPNLSVVLDKGSSIKVSEDIFSRLDNWKIIV